MRETRRCQMSVPARSLMVATSIIAAIVRRVGLLPSWDRGRPARPLVAAQSWERARRPRSQEGWGRIAVLFAVLVAVAVAAAQAGAAEATRIRVNTFPNAKASPVHFGIAKGLFAKYGLAVELENTESSQSQRDGLAAGRFQIAPAALDNAVAMIDGPKRYAVIVAGGDSGIDDALSRPATSSAPALERKRGVV